MDQNIATIQAETDMETSPQCDTPSYGTTISLRMWHPSVLSDQITKAIGLTPSLCNDAGAPRKTPTGQALDGVYDQTYWLYKFSFFNGFEVDECIAEVLESLSPKREFLQYIITSGGRCELFIGVFLQKNAGIELTGNLVRRVADAGLGLSFDVYPLAPYTKAPTGLQVKL